MPFYSHQMVNRVPHEVAIENLPLHPHIAANVAEPPLDHGKRNARQQLVGNRHDHATVTIVAEGRFDRGRIS